MKPEFGMMLRCVYSGGMGLIVKVNHEDEIFTTYWMNETESHFSTTNNDFLQNWLKLGSVKVL